MPHEDSSALSAKKGALLKYYIQIAKRYFDKLEGLHLYPSARSFPAVLWTCTLALWLTVIAVVLTHPSWGFTWTMFAVLTGSELAWLLVVMWISSHKDKRLVVMTNESFGTSFPNAAECRYYLLGISVGRPASDYLTIAKEIRDLMEIRSKFRKRSDLQLSEFWRSIYDRESKARLLALVIATCSMIVALSARSNSTLESVFDAYGDPVWQRLVALLAVVALTFFLSTYGFKVLILTLMDWVALWGAKSKKLGHAFFEDWVVAYFIRDLVHFYEPTTLGLLEVAKEGPWSRNTPVPELSECRADERGLEPSKDDVVESPARDSGSSVAV